QVVDLVDDRPRYAAALQAAATRLADLLTPLGLTDAQSVVGALPTDLQTVGSVLASGAVGILARLADGVLNAVLALVLSVYLTAGGPRVARWLERDTPSPVRRRATW